jgi:4-diphosphocytidyl-2-C-methyl-D-erythritol kinase
VSRAVVYRSYAKLNLYLDVLGPRDDGFHDLETIFQTVDLWDELHFTPSDGGITLTCSEPSLPTDATNLVHAAAQLLLDTTQGRGVTIHLEKRIPAGAGLAGGSGNAAATLRALNALWDLQLSEARLAELALSLGSDVPYCLRGGTRAATGRGEILSPLTPLENQWFVLVHPALALSTGTIFGHPKLTHSTEMPVDGRTPAFAAAITALDQGDWPQCLFNRMETPAFHEHPVLADWKKRLLEAGCSASMMSGTGVTVFGVCHDEAQARTVQGALGDVRTSVVQSVPFGVAVDTTC